MRYSLAVGLVLRRGMRTFEFVRELSAEEVQLEDVETRRPLTIRKGVGALLTNAYITMA